MLTPTHTGTRGSKKLCLCSARTRLHLPRPRACAFTSHWRKGKGTFLSCLFGYSLMGQRPPLFGQACCSRLAAAPSCPAPARPFSSPSPSLPLRGSLFSVLMPRTPPASFHQPGPLSPGMPFCDAFQDREGDSWPTGVMLPGLRLRDLPAPSQFPLLFCKGNHIYIVNLGLERVWGVRDMDM